MKVRIHYPSTEEGLKALNEKLVEAHANAILDYIDNLKCSYEDKVWILKQVSEKK